ncbi:claudin-34-like [Eptesicus fuscus]|uniref:claudin-34-like n=1 Tax=Eptesicus fuscus TaxID=29078 RepID=UPI0024046945|nr:claudin-34-like [Eptesicus fuscus]XP_054571454.1 claudin-34-like [Eptesicus fuscus]
MALFEKANCQAASLTINILGWILTVVCMGQANWRVWYIESSPAPPWGLAYVGMWKVCTYQPDSLQTRPIACHRYTYRDTYLPMDIRFAQNLLLAASLLGLLGNWLIIMGLRRVYAGQLQKDTTCNLFLISRILSIVAGSFIFIAVLCNYHAVKNEEGIHFPPSFHIPFSPERQEIGSAVYLAVPAACLMLLSGLFTISFQLPPTAKGTPKSCKCEIHGCIALQIQDKQFMGVK